MLFILPNIPSSHRGGLFSRSEFRSRRASPPTLLHDRDSGEVIQEITGAGLEVVVAQDEGAVLSADPVGGSVELGTIRESGYQQEWRRPPTAFVPEDVAPRYGPNGGWRGQITESGMVIFGFAAFEGDDATQDEWEEALRLGDMVGVVGDDGDVLLGIHGVDLAYDLAWIGEGFTVASGLEFKREQDFDDDGQLDLEPTFSRLSYYPLPGLEPVEAPTLEALESFGGMVTETSDPNLVLLRYSEDPLVFSRSDGSVESAAGLDLLVGCDIDGVDALEDLSLSSRSMTARPLSTAPPTTSSVCATWRVVSSIRRRCSNQGSHCRAGSASASSQTTKNRKRRMGCLRLPSGWTTTESSTADSTQEPPDRVSRR